MAKQTFKASGDRRAVHLVLIRAVADIRMEPDLKKHLMGVVEHLTHAFVSESNASVTLTFDLETKALTFTAKEL